LKILPGFCPVLDFCPGFPGFHDLDKIISFFDKIDQSITGQKTENFFPIGAKKLKIVVIEKTWPTLVTYFSQAMEVPKSIRSIFNSTESIGICKI
jgi:hypothetical protein